MKQNLIDKHFFSGQEFMTFDDFKELSSFGETNLVERKELKSFVKDKNKFKEMLSKQISAFGNYSGGFLLLGADNDDNITEGSEGNLI